MKERDNIQFFDISSLSQTENIRSRCEAKFLEEKLQHIFSGETIRVVSAAVNETGRYARKASLLMSLLGAGSKIKNLPAFCEVQLEHQTGKFTEFITVWSPLAWNDRFLGAAGGGTLTGGVVSITQPNNTSRGTTMPMAIRNGFTVATTNGGNSAGRNDWALDPDTRMLNWELIENWRAAGTHFMTRCGKAIAEILHGRPVQYSYLHGGSGGGRQSMVEAQEYPDDYNGIWASCPAINWTKFVIAGFWSIAVMNKYNSFLSPKKLKYFKQAVHAVVGGPDAYYRQTNIVEFDPASVIGQKTGDGLITAADAAVMKEIWNGPHRASGERLWYGFRPGSTFWNVVIPIGAFYYPLAGKKPKPFALCTDYARWVTQDPNRNFDTITIDEFEELFDKSTALFETAAGDKADLRHFAAAGGKLMIDHGLDDPLIPVDGTIDYYERMCEIHGGKAAADEFCRLYLTPGDGHGNCSGHGPGLTECEGMRALIDWVEQGKAPDKLRVVQVAPFSGEKICERMQAPV